jgi:hypothetical protein
MAEPRHSRQARLPEVGDAGQARIHDATVRLSGDGLAARVAARYAAGAGFGRLEIGDPRALSSAREVDPRVVVSIQLGRTEAPVLPEWIGALEEGPRAVAAGAWEVLSAMRAALGVGDE